jgi:signal transduction histidine kinase
MMMVTRSLFRRLLPDSTCTQVVAIVVASLVLAHLLIIGTFMYLNNPNGTPAERVAAHEIGLITRVYLAVPPSERARVVAAASLPAIRVQEQTGTQPAFAAVPPGSDATLRAVEVAIRQPGHRVAAGFTPSTAAAAQANLRRITVEVGERTWLVFDITMPQWARPTAIPVRVLLSMMILIGVPLVLLTGWATLKVTNPLRRLALFTERFGDLGSHRPLPTAGTREIRKLANAFNTILERLHRMVADRTNMLAAISHDLRTPLTRLRLRTEALEDGVLRGKMLRDIQAMDFMVASTLGYIEQQHSREAPEALDLAALMQTLCDDFADGGYDVTYEGPLHCAASCRPIAMERALNNLIDNAVKFGGHVQLSLHPTGDSLVVEVRDDGPGIAADEREKVLKPFYRTDTARGSDTGGVGLGLAIVNTIVEADGGSLQLLDAEPRGLCVRLRLPR